MIKLALIGKDIQHSRSPEMYRRLLNVEIRYELLDYSRENLIPSAKELLSKFDGVSVTSPYKKHFLNEVQLTENAQLLGAINCLCLKEGQLLGENTDYLAIVDILKRAVEKNQGLNVLILGDGVMARVTALALKKLGIEFKMLSRKTVDNFNQLNLVEIFNDSFLELKQKMVINTCAREYIFKGKIDAKTIFWDYNYNFFPHSSSLPFICQQYVDGLEMLELQSHHALAFWSIGALI